jgi:Ca-activated chloride channel family protein
MKGPESFEFGSPWFLLLLVLPPILLWLRGRPGNAPAILFSSLEALRPLGRRRRASTGAWWAGMTALAMALWIIAIARPRMGQSFQRIQASGIDIVLALDVSRSMLAEDFTIGSERANRLQAVQQITQKFIENRPADRIGIVAFAGKPYLVSPLTLDHDWLLQNLERIRIGLVEDGTAIGSAIASATNRLKERDSKSRILVLLTDGDNNAGKITPATAAEAAKTLGIKIYTICAGSRGFAPIPVPDMFGRTVYRNIKVEVDEGTLKQVAAIGGGQFFRAEDSASLNSIFKQIDQLEKTTIELDRYMQYRELYLWPAAAGCLLLVLHLLLRQTVLRRLP